MKLKEMTRAPRELNASVTCPEYLNNPKIPRLVAARFLIDNSPIAELLITAEIIGSRVFSYAIEFLLFIRAITRYPPKL